MTVELGSHVQYMSGGEEKHSIARWEMPNVIELVLLDERERYHGRWRLETGTRQASR